MRVLVFEFVTAGGLLDAEVSTSLADEGGAMLAAVLDDLGRIPGVHLATVCRRGAALPRAVETHRVDSPDECLRQLRNLTHNVDATLVIAPETDGILERCTRLVEGSTARLLGAGSKAVALCADKLALCEWLHRREVPTIETHSLACFDPNRIEFPCVIKPRDGAGSQSTHLVRSPDEWRALRETLSQSPLGPNGIWQPFVAGRALSVAVLVDPDRDACLPLPVCEQTLSDDGRFHYLGGIVPARDVPVDVLQQTAVAACKCVAGLRGYVGVDLVLPDATAHRPLVVEINPRLTTSYLGYTRLADENLGRRLLDLDATSPMRWGSEQIHFGGGF